MHQPEVFQARGAERAPDAMADIAHLESEVAKAARALVLLKPHKVIECLYGSCPDGRLGVFGRFGSAPLYGAETYRLAFEMFSRPENKLRAKVLGQLAGQVRAEHVMVVAGLADESRLGWPFQPCEVACSAFRISSNGSAPTALAMAMYSATSSRRSSVSYFDTKVCRLPMRAASSTCVMPASFRAWMSAWSRAL